MFPSTGPYLVTHMCLALNLTKQRVWKLIKEGRITPHPTRYDSRKYGWPRVLFFLVKEAYLRDLQDRKTQRAIVANEKKRSLKVAAMERTAARLKAQRAALGLETHQSAGGA